MSSKKTSLLWSIEKEANVSYLFGTMHVEDYRVHAVTDFVTPYLQQCESFGTEFHLDEMSELDQTNFQYFPNGETLKDHWSDKQYNKFIQSIKKSFQIDVSKFDHMLPIFIVNMISETVLVNSENMPLDTALWQHAKGRGLELFGLETLEDQFRILASIPIAYQLESIRSIARNPKLFRKKLKKLIDLYERQEIDQLYQVSKKSLGKQRQLMLYARNEKMVQRLREELRLAKRVFCAVGAAHLSGKFGMLALLKRMEYKVKPVIVNGH